MKRIYTHLSYGNKGIPYFIAEKLKKKKPKKIGLNFIAVLLYWLFLYQFLLCEYKHARGMVENRVYFVVVVVIVEYCFVPDISLFSILNYRPGDKSERAYPHRCIHCVTYFRLNHTLIWKVTFQITHSLTHNLSIVQYRHLLAHSIVQHYKADALATYYNITIQ